MEIYCSVSQLNTINYGTKIKHERRVLGDPGRLWDLPYGGDTHWTEDRPSQNNDILVDSNVKPVKFYKY
jgi:hypothetical protein